jgi:dTDP-4-amino-4,6-dideoxygalactose transaminase
LSGATSIPKLWFQERIYGTLVPSLVQWGEFVNSFRIPFNKPSLSGDELLHVAESIRAGHISSDGRFTERCRELLETEFAVPGVLLTTSCTHALEMAALLMDIKVGDEVIIPSFTFVSTVNAFVLRGAVPKFVDVRPDTLNIDETLIEPLITARTKAIVAVHYAGVGCEMDAILSLAKRHKIKVIEDNAHGVFGRFRDKQLGTFGSLATLSFHETKNVTCGEGGALVVNDEVLLERAEIIRDKGTNRKRFLRGQVDKYTWVDVGSSYGLSDILAAYLYAQLEKREEIQASRQKIWHRYYVGLNDWALDHDVQLPFVPDHCEQAYHMFYMVLPSLEIRQALIDYLKNHGILSVFHYLPLHLSEMGMRNGGRPGQCPVSEDVSNRLLRLPFYNSLSDAEQLDVVNAIKAFAFPRANGTRRTSLQAAAKTSFIY